MTQEQKELVELAACVSPKDAPAAKRMLESLLVDPFWLSLRAAPCDDEPVTPDEHAAIEEARGSVRRGEPLVPHDEVLREFSDCFATLQHDDPIRVANGRDAMRS